MRTKYKKEEKPIYIVGLDFSITEPGIVVYNSKLGLTYTRTFEKVERKDFKYKVDRAKAVVAHIIDQLHMELLNPNNLFIVMEDYAYGAKGRTFDIAETASILKYTLRQIYKFNFDNFKLVCIQHLKQFTGAKGNCGKDLVIKNCLKRWDFDTDNNNVADAFVLCQIGKALNDIWDQPATEFQKDILGRIKTYNQKDLK
jgi:hypothetical protein